MKALFLLAALALLTLPGGAHAKRLKIKAKTASSSYPTEEGVSYDAPKATDGKLSTAWVEGEEGSGLGSWIEIDLDGEHTVHTIKFWGGLWYSHEYWDRANRPKEVEIRWSDDSTESFSMTDEMTVQVFTPASPKVSSTVRIRIKQIYSGNTWLDTALSEIQVVDDASEDFAPVREATASSVSAADADGDYGAGNVSDGMSDSMWCEGNADGDGTDEWLEFSFAGAHEIDELALINGIGTGLPFWMKGNRATKATLTFSDGSTEDITIRNTMLPQKVSFGAKSTESVKITFTEVARGKEYNDLCISEAYFE